MTSLRLFRQQYRYNPVPCSQIKEPAPRLYFHKIRKKNSIYAKTEFLRILNQFKTVKLQIIQSLARKRTASFPFFCPLICRYLLLFKFRKLLHLFFCNFLFLSSRFKFQLIRHIFSDLFLIVFQIYDYFLPICAERSMNGQLL